MAMSALAKQSEDKIARQAYQRRKDEIFYYNKNMSERDEYKRKAEQAQLKAAQEQHRAEQAESALAEKDAALASQEKIIAELRSQLNKN
jgi:hypothetical protein